MTRHTPKPPNQLCAQFRLIPSADAGAATKPNECICSAHWRMVTLITDHGAEEEDSAALWRAPLGSTRRLKLSAVQPGYHNLQHVWSVLLCLLLTRPAAFQNHRLPEVRRLHNFPRAHYLLVFRKRFFFPPSLHRGPVSWLKCSVLIMIHWFSQFTLENHCIVCIVST